MEDIVNNKAVEQVKLEDNSELATAASTGVSFSAAVAVVKEDEEQEEEKEEETTLRPGGAAELDISSPSETVTIATTTTTTTSQPQSNLHPNHPGHFDQMGGPLGTAAVGTSHPAPPPLPHPLLINKTLSKRLRIGGGGGVGGSGVAGAGGGRSGGYLHHYHHAHNVHHHYNQLHPSTTARPPQQAPPQAVAANIRSGASSNNVVVRLTAGLVSTYMRVNESWYSSHPNPNSSSNNHSNRKLVHTNSTNNINFNNSSNRQHHQQHGTTSSFSTSSTKPNMRLQQHPLQLPPADYQVKVGEIWLDCLRITRLLGRGSFGQVVEAVLLSHPKDNNNNITSSYSADDTIHAAPEDELAMMTENNNDVDDGADEGKLTVEDLIETTPTARDQLQLQQHSSSVPAASAPQPPLTNFVVASASSHNTPHHPPQHQQSSSSTATETPTAKNINNNTSHYDPNHLHSLNSITPGSKLAIKIIKNKRSFFNQAHIEIRILEELMKKDPMDDKGIVRMRGHFIHKEHLCIIYELLSINLYELLYSTRFHGVSLPLVRSFGAQILCTLQFLGRRDVGVIHCDLKPENILLRDQGSDRIKVIDFGSSCFQTERAYSYIQSRFYRSPEVILNYPYSVAIDMWSLGCILVELLCGEPLFPGTNEHDQLCRICNVLGGVPPDSLIEVSAPAKIAKFFATVAPVGGRGGADGGGGAGGASLPTCSSVLATAAATGVGSNNSNLLSTSLPVSLNHHQSFVTLSPAAKSNIPSAAVNTSTATMTAEIGLPTVTTIVDSEVLVAGQGEASSISCLDGLAEAMTGMTLQQQQQQQQQSQSGQSALSRALAAAAVCTVSGSVGGSKHKLESAVPPVAPPPTPVAIGSSSPTVNSKEPYLQQQKPSKWRLVPAPGFKSRKRLRDFVLEKINREERLVVAVPHTLHRDSISSVNTEIAIPDVRTHGGSAPAVATVGSFLTSPPSIAPGAEDETTIHSESSAATLSHTHQPNHQPQQQQQNQFCQPPSSSDISMPRSPSLTDYAKFIHLVTRMLHFHPHERITADEAAQHAFFTPSIDMGCNTDLTGINNTHVSMCSPGIVVVAEGMIGKKAGIVGSDMVDSQTLMASSQFSYNHPHLNTYHLNSASVSGNSVIGGSNNINGSSSNTTHHPSSSSSSLPASSAPSSVSSSMYSHHLGNQHHPPLASCSSSYYGVGGQHYSSANIPSSSLRSSVVSSSIGSGSINMGGLVSSGVSCSSTLSIPLTSGSSSLLSSSAPTSLTAGGSSSSSNSGGHHRYGGMATFASSVSSSQSQQQPFPNSVSSPSVSSGSSVYGGGGGGGGGGGSDTLSLYGGGRKSISAYSSSSSSSVSGSSSNYHLLNHQPHHQNQYVSGVGSSRSSNGGGGGLMNSRVGGQGNFNNSIMNRAAVPLSSSSSLSSSKRSKTLSSSVSPLQRFTSFASPSTSSSSPLHHHHSRSPLSGSSYYNRLIHRSSPLLQSSTSRRSPTNVGGVTVVNSTPSSSTSPSASCSNRTPVSSSSSNSVPH